MKGSLFTQHALPDEPAHYNLISHSSKSQQKKDFLLLSPTRAVWCNPEEAPCLVTLLLPVPPFWEGAVF